MALLRVILGRATSGVARLHRAFGNSLQRACAKRSAVGPHLSCEGIRACHAGRSGAFAHPSDAPPNGRCGRWPEWRCRPPWPAPDDVDLQDSAAGNQSWAKLSVAGPSNSVGPKLARSDYSGSSAAGIAARGMHPEGSGVCNAGRLDIVRDGSPAEYVVPAVGTPRRCQSLAGIIPRIGAE